MKKKFIFIFCAGILLNISTVTFADVEQRRSELISVLDEELREVARLNKQIGASRPDLMLRMAQVLLEKGRLLKDAENQKYLEIPAKDRDKVSRDEMFKESRKYFDQAQKTVLVLLKKFPKFDERGDAYYILAFNAKDLKQDEESKKFFQKALDESRSGSVVQDKSRIALAEMYFNKGSFDKAMNLYEGAIKVKRDKWWTKDAFNLSWCYFKLGKYDKAIGLMNESYDLSKNSKFIDMSKSIERDLAFFYTEAGKSDEAIAFYKRNGKSVADVMLKVGKHLKTQGRFAAAEKTLSEGLQYKQSEKEEIEFNVELLSLYEKFGKDQKHLEACKTLSAYFSKGSLNDEQVEVLKFNTQKMAALIQQQLVNKTYENQTEIKNKKASAVYDYFMINAQVDPKKSEESYFHAAETYFAIASYDKAVPLYAEAIKRAKTNGNKKIEESAGNGLMVSLGKGVSKDTQVQYLIPAYQSYLSANPNGEKSNVIYQRLFSSQMEKKNIKDAEETLLSYKKNFPNEFETQEKMLAQVMDFHKDLGDKASLASWAKKVDTGEFNVSPGYKEKVKTLMLGMQFEKVEQASSKGDKKGALRGYLQIYKSPETSRDAKKTAAYNIAVLFYETGEYKQMYAWAQKAIDLMDQNEISKFEKDLILFSTDLFQRRQFNESADLSEKVFAKICNAESKNKKVFFKNANVIYLSNKEFEKSKSLIQKAQKCGVANEAIMAGYLDHLNDLAGASRWTSFNEVIKTLESSKEMLPYLIYPTSLLANELENIGRVDESKKLRTKMLSYYESSKKSKIEVPFEALDAIAFLKIAPLEEETKKLKSIKLEFPEATYNKALKSKFALLDKVTTDAVAIAEIGSGMGMVKAYRLLVSGHENLRDEITAFTPEGKSEEYVKSFKKSMEKLVAPLSKQAADFRNVAIRKIESESILSDDNSWFLQKSDASFIPEFYTENGAALMDKGGVK